MARDAWSKWFPQCIEDNFLKQVVEEPTRQGLLLGLVLMNRDGLVRDMKFGGSLGCSNHEMVKFKILSGKTKAKKAGLLSQTFGEPTLTSAGTYLEIPHGLEC